MVPLTVDLLLRPEAPPLPPDAPTYTLSLAWDADGALRGEGTVSIPNPGPEPLSAVPLLLHGNDGIEATTRVTRAEGVGRAVTVDADVRELVLRPSPPVPPGGTLEVDLAWEVTIRSQPPGTDDLLMQGLMQLGAGAGGSYGLQAHGDGVTVLASAYPMVAPRAAGIAAPRVVRPDQPIGDQSWNGPARWDVTIAPPPGVRVVTNLADEPLADGRVRARGAGPWDLVIVGYDAPPVVATQVVNGVTVRSWARAGDEAGARAALAEAAHALRFLERYGRYPYRELDVAEAALSGGAGGVEFGGLALVASFLYREPAGGPLGALGALGGTALDVGELRAFVVAHEVAHQWSPGLLVADAWAQPIVDEPLAQYLAWRVLAGGRSSAEADALFGRQVTTGYAGMRLLGGDDGVAARETTAFPDPMAYGGLVYGKAPHLYRALEDEVGAPALDRALAAAFAARAWTAVDGRGWLALLEAEGAPGASALGERWWWGASGDADLGLDPEGHAALRLMLGPQAAAFEAVLARTGTTPAAYFAEVGRLARGGWR